MMSMIPSSVFLAHIFPKMETEVDAFHALVTLSPPTSKEERDDVLYSWIRSPYSTLLKKCIDRFDYMRFDKLVQLYPRILCARDGRIMSEILLLCLEAPHDQVYNLLSVFRNSIFVLMNLDTPQDSVAMMHRNSERFMRQLLSRVFKGSAMNASVLPLVLHTLCLPIAFSKDIFYDAFHSGSCNVIWNGLLRSFQSLDELMHMRSYDIMSCLLIASHSYANADLNARTDYMLHLLDNLLFTPSLDKTKSVYMAHLLVTCIVNDMQKMTKEDRFDLIERMRLRVTEAYVQAVRLDDMRMLNTLLRYFVDTPLHIPYEDSENRIALFNPLLAMEISASISPEVCEVVECAIAHAYYDPEE